MVQATVISAVEVQKCIGTEDRKAIQDPFKKKKSPTMEVRGLDWNRSPKNGIEFHLVRTGWSSFFFEKEVNAYYYTKSRRYLNTEKFRLANHSKCHK